MRYELFLDHSAARFPDKRALIDGDRSLTYLEWQEAADRLAASLLADGFTPRDRAIIFLENSLEAAIAVFGVLKAGGVFSVVNPSTKHAKLAFMLNNCRATAVITQEKLLSTAVQAIAEAPSVSHRVVSGREGRPPDGWHSFEAATKSSPSARRDVFVGTSTDLAMIIYTSGSTGAPKGVMMTHQNIDAASWSITTYLENQEDDVILCAIPLAFDYGLYQLLMACRLGATLVLEKSFTYPAHVLQSCRRWEVTGFPLVPTMAALLVQMKDIKSSDFAALRYITNTAAALPPAHIRRLRDLFPTARVYSMYGLTECKRCTYLPPAELDRRPDSVGIAIPGTEAYLVDERGERIGHGSTGILAVRGPHVMQGYWENPAATEKMLKPGVHPWERVLITGDLFRSDADGYLYFVGRSDDIIKTRGEKVSPKEVENVLYGLTGVTEAAVVGVDDEILGSAIMAVLVVDKGCQYSVRDVQKYCAEHLEAFMVPKFVEFRDELPKTDTGKIRRREV